MGLVYHFAMARHGQDPPGQERDVAERTRELHGGRRARRQRATRDSLVRAAVQLLDEAGESAVSVPSAADLADVSRATAYRYFPNREALLGDALLELSFGLSGRADSAVLAELEAIVASTPDHVERVGRVVRVVAEWSFDQQKWLRSSLRASLERSAHGDGYSRPGHRLEWIDLALAPVAGAIPSEEFDRLAAALVTLMGVDPVVPLVDLAGCDRAGVADTLEWAARRLVQAVLAQSSEGSTGPRKRR